jgi:hypothetical protein
MTRYDLLKNNEQVLGLFVRNLIDFREVNNLAIFEEYTDMRNRNEKYAYTIRFLSDKYGKTESCIIKIVQRMTSDVVV